MLSCDAVAFTHTSRLAGTASTLRISWPRTAHSRSTWRLYASATPYGYLDCPSSAYISPPLNNFQLPENVFAGLYAMTKLDRDCRTRLTILPRDILGIKLRIHNRSTCQDSPEENCTHMATPAQIEANRRHAEKSTGPTSENGKARSCRNRLSHGFTSSVLFIAGEEREEFNMHPDLGLLIRYHQSSDRGFYKARTELLNAQKERKKSEIGFESQNAAQPAEAPAPAPNPPDPPQETTAEPGLSVPALPGWYDFESLEDQLEALMNGPDGEIAKQIAEWRARRQAA